MKIIAVDISYNNPPQKAGLFLKLHSNADLIYVFDHQYCEYDSARALRDDLNRYPDEFYSRPSAYYDMVIAILSKAKEYQPDSIVIFSPGIDDCSRFANDITFSDYIRHFNRYHPDILDLANSPAGYASGRSQKSIRDTNHKFSEWSEEFLPSFHLIDAIKELFTKPVSSDLI